MVRGLYVGDWGRGVSLLLIGKCLLSTRKRRKDGSNTTAIRPLLVVGYYLRIQHIGSFLLSQGKELRTKNQQHQAIGNEHVVDPCAWFFCFFGAVYMLRRGRQPMQQLHLQIDGIVGTLALYGTHRAPPPQQQQTRRPNFKSRPTPSPPPPQYQIICLQISQSSIPSSERHLASADTSPA